MKGSISSISKAFYQKMLMSSFILVFVSLLLFFLSNLFLKEAGKNYFLDKTSQIDSYTMEELGKYFILDNSYAMDLLLHKITIQKKLDSIEVLKSLSLLERKYHCIINSDNKTCLKSDDSLVLVVPIHYDGDVISYLGMEKKYTYTPSVPIMKSIGLILAGILLSLLFNYIYLFISLEKKIVNSTSDLIKEIESLSGDINLEGKYDYFEYKEIALMFRKVTKEIKVLQKEKVYTEAVQKITTQVSHDIRSPLAALNMVTGELDILPESTRILLRGSINRIQDIANNLLRENNKEENTKTSTYLISPIIDEIVSEKRTQLRSKMNISIDLNKDNLYGAFAKLNQSDLKRILSNLINNSIEAFKDNVGQIEIALTKSMEKELIYVSISDNGKGIPKEIISKLGQRGVSFGKDDSEVSGSGLGLYHAKDCMESWGGCCSIESIEGRGTTLILSFPAVEAPSWFISGLCLEDRQKILIIDDDASIHQIWDKRLDDIKSMGELDIYHFTSPEEASDWVKNSDLSDGEIIFLCDYEFIGHDQNGLDFIKENELCTNSILVTSHYEEEDVRFRCNEMGVKLLPKMMVESIPIVLNEEVKSTVDLVHLDDDELIRMCWNMSAKKKDKHILSFSNSSDLKKELSTLSKETAFYIDSCLGEDALPGQDFAKELYNLGYENLYLSTGYEKEKFKNMPWIKDVTGKAPPWDNIHI